MANALLTLKPGGRMKPGTLRQSPGMAQHYGSGMAASDQPPVGAPPVASQPGIDESLLWGQNYYNRFGGSLVPTQMPIFRASDLVFNPAQEAQYTENEQGRQLMEQAQPARWSIGNAGLFGDGEDFGHNTYFSLNENINAPTADPNSRPAGFDFGIKEGDRTGRVSGYTLDPTGQYYIPTTNYGMVGGRGSMFDTNYSNRELNRDALKFIGTAVGGYYAAGAGAGAGAAEGAAVGAGGAEAIPISLTGGGTTISELAPLAGYGGGAAGAGGALGAAGGGGGATGGSMGVEPIATSGMSPSVAGGGAPTTTGTGLNALTSSWGQYAPLFGGIVSAIGSQYAAHQQRGAAREATAAQQAMFEQNRQDMAPWRETGAAGLSRLSYLLGLGENDGGADFGSLMRDFKPDDLENEPGYQFRRQQGEQSINQNALARGRYNSGSALRALTEYNSGLASQEYGDAYNRFAANRDSRFNALASLAGLGQRATTQTNADRTGLGNVIGGNIIGAGNASAAGTVGATNAINGALSQYANNQQSQQQMQQQQQQQEQFMQNMLWALRARG